MEPDVLRFCNLSKFRDRVDHTVRKARRGTDEHQCLVVYCVRHRIDVGGEVFGNGYAHDFEAEVLRRFVKRRMCRPRDNDASTRNFAPLARGLVSTRFDREHDAFGAPGRKVPTRFRPCAKQPQPHARDVVFHFAQRRKCARQAEAVFGLVERVGVLRDLHDICAWVEDINRCPGVAPIDVIAPRVNQCFAHFFPRTAAFRH